MRTMVGGGDDPLVLTVKIDVHGMLCDAVIEAVGCDSRAVYNEVNALRMLILSALATSE